MNQAYVRFDVSASGVAWIEFFHPMSNSLPHHILMKLADTITDLGNDDSVKVIVLSSSGEKAFCAGASFDELVSIKTEEEGLRFFSGFAHVINACRKVKKFVVGRIQGKAVGGGVGLAASVDYCFATKAAEIKLSELAIGIGPFVVGPAVERKIGLAAMSELAINATEWRSAYWAKEKGLYTSTFETTQSMDTEIEQLTERLSKTSPEAMAELKRIFWQNTQHWDDLLIERAKISGRLVLSEFTRNAIQTFKKR